jgi:hypothetical protein
MVRSQAAEKPDEIVVFSIVRDSACSECQRELWKGAFLRMEKERPLCLSCADLDHLVFLPRGDTALTRRASKYSALRAVVVRFSRTRKRYERQGILVEEQALERAEQECLADEEARARARERAAERRAAENEEYVAAFRGRVAELFPNAPAAEQRAIAARACRVGSGRIGRTAAAKELDASAIELAVRAHVRHQHTRYDQLLARGGDRSEARAEVQWEVEEVLAAWRGSAPA